jgi:hypothetical protein
MPGFNCVILKPKIMTVGIINQQNIPQGWQNGSVPA